MDVAHARGAETQPPASITHGLLCGLHGLSKAGPCPTLAAHASTIRIKMQINEHTSIEGLCPNPQATWRIRTSTQAESEGPRAHTSLKSWVPLVRGPDSIRGGLRLSCGGPDITRGGP